MELTSLSIHVYITIELHIRQFQLSSLSILKIHLYKCISVWHCRHWRLLKLQAHGSWFSFVCLCKACLIEQIMHHELVKRHLAGTINLQTFH